MTSPLICARCKATFSPEGYLEELQAKLEMCPSCVRTYAALAHMLNNTRPLDRDACGKPLRVYSIMPPVDPASTGLPELEVHAIMPAGDPPVCVTCADRDGCTYKKTRTGTWRDRCATWRRG